MTRFIEWIMHAPNTRAELYNLDPDESASTVYTHPTPTQGPLFFSPITMLNMIVKTLIGTPSTIQEEWYALEQESNVITHQIPQ